ncbi:MAG: kelch repeat-containing protein, partial [Gemmatimonadaceae bacterium]
VAQARDTTAPPHRRHHAIAYDPASKRVLVYGGQHLVSNSNAPMLDDLWSWDGQRWTRVAATGTVNIAHRIFTDDTGGLFSVGGPRGVTARWDGRAWITVVEDSTSQREMAATAYDAQRKRVVIFGGHIGGRAFPIDTREFDGRQWTQVATSGPPALIGGAMAYDARRHATVLFGGIEPTGRKLNETWEWDGARWTRVSSEGPSPRFGASMAYDVSQGEIILFGGADSTNQKLNDTWRWDGRSWRRAETSFAPPPRSEGYLAYDEARGVIVMFGGEGAETIPTLGDTWEWDGTKWTRVR